MIQNYTPKATPVLRAFLWEGIASGTPLIAEMTGLTDEHEIEQAMDIILNSSGPLDIRAMPFRYYIVKGTTGHYFAVRKEEFEEKYRQVDINRQGQVVERYWIARQPQIPIGVDDWQLRSEGDTRVWYFISEGHGLVRWADERRKWGMPEEMIRESMPHSIEYWREACPYWRDGLEVKMEQDSQGEWWWVVIG